MLGPLTVDYFRSSHIQTAPKEKKLNMGHPNSYLIVAYIFHWQMLILFSKV